MEVKTWKKASRFGSQMGTDEGMVLPLKYQQIYYLNGENASDRIIKLKLQIEGIVMDFVHVYAPQVDLKGKRENSLVYVPCGKHNHFT